MKINLLPHPIAMRKTILYTCALLMIAGCANDDIIGGENNGKEEALSEAIAFGFDLSNVTRGEDLVGSSAATKLQNQFVVYGTKHKNAEATDATNDAAVFTNYKVEYTASSAGTTSSNTNDWEYVGLTPYASSKVSPAVTSQGVKFWDYSADNGYTFYGIASKNDITNDKVTITKVTTGTTVYDKGYSVVIKNGAELDKLYVSDRLPVAKENYNKPVTLKFRNFGSRVRVGFYETIPGYTVKIDKFYYDDDASAAVTTFEAMDKVNTNNFSASLQNISTAAASNTLTVSYYDGTNGPVNQVKVTPSSVTYGYTLTLGGGFKDTELANSSATPTWDKPKTGEPGVGEYTTVYPIEATNPMLVKIDYTLTAEDGGGETIEVKGANVVVPAAYMTWKPNYAYTYLFKITDDQLKPITFDAVVVDDGEGHQETITTVTEPSITTLGVIMDGTTFKNYVTGKNEYQMPGTDKLDIYAIFMKGSNVLTPQLTNNDKDNFVKVYSVGYKAGTTDADKTAHPITEASVAYAIAHAGGLITATHIATAENDYFTTSPAPVTTVPGEDGINKNIDALKLTGAKQAGKYAVEIVTYEEVTPADGASLNGLYDKDTTDNTKFVAVTSGFGDGSKKYYKQIKTYKVITVV